MTDRQITLADTTYTIPPLAVKQLRELDWRILAAAPALADRRLMTQEVRDTLFDIVYVALTAGQPGLTREAFDARNVPLLDVLRAIPAVIDQTGMFSPKPAAEAATPGEPNPPTGTGW